MPKKSLSKEEKGQILALKSCGRSISHIAMVMNRNRHTISTLIKRADHLPPGQVPDRKYSPGRPRKVNEHASRVMKRAFLRSPRKSCKQLKYEYPEVFGSAKIRTLQNHACRRLGFKSRVARKKPLLTELHKKKRLAFAKLYSKWTKEQWRRVMWSDESTFRVNYETQKKVRRPAHKKGSAVGDPFDPKVLQATVKHPASTMVWAAFTGNAGRGSIHFVPDNTTITARSYLDLLKDKLRDTMEIHDASHFVQDGASVHTAKIVKKWLNDNKIECVSWPPQSPDLNPIENMWIHMKRQLENYDTRSLPKLKEAILKLWCQDMNLDTFIKYADTMPDRLKEVIKRKGGATHY